MQMFYTSPRHFSPGAPLDSLNHSAKTPIERENSPDAKQRPYQVGKWLRQYRVNILLLALACLAALSTFFHLLTPVLAESFANGLPASWVRTSSEQVLAEMDSTVLSASTLPLPQQDDLREQFAALNPAPEGAPPYRLLFRNSQQSGATLFSLPGGEIIVTDAFLRNVPARNEQLALLCHELGHLYHHHALRSAIEHELPNLAWAAFVGSSDASIRALTAGLRQTDFSLAHLLEADRYAVSMLQANHLPVSLLPQAIEHGQHPAEGMKGTDTAAHQRYFADRIHMLQNFR